jgi:hypothetical protein
VLPRHESLVQHPGTATLGCRRGPLATVLALATEAFKHAPNCAFLGGNLHPRRPYLIRVELEVSGNASAMPETERHCNTLVCPATDSVFPSVVAAYSRGTGDVIY